MVTGRTLGLYDVLKVNSVILKLTECTEYKTDNVDTTMVHIELNLSRGEIKPEANRWYGAGLTITLFINRPKHVRHIPSPLTE